MTQELLDSDEIVTELDISHLVIEDDTPMDNLQFEKQQRLLVEPLYSSKPLPPPSLAAANVGLLRLKMLRRNRTRKIQEWRPLLKN